VTDKRILTAINAIPKISEIARGTISDHSMIIRFHAIGLTSLLSLALLTSLFVVTSGRSDFNELEPNSPKQRYQRVSDVQGISPLTFKEVNTTTNSCRNGVVVEGHAQEDWVDELGAGWYVFFGGFPAAAENGAESVPVIAVKQKKDIDGNYLDDYTILPSLTDESLGALLDFFPGKLWIVGNEVDRGPNPNDPNSTGQGDTFPAVYARAYHDVYQFIKQRDPSAQVAISGLVEVTPGRLQYLDIVWQTYLRLYGEPMPVDVWNMHLYILPEVRHTGEPNGIASVALGTDPSIAIRESNNDPSQCARSDVYCYAEHDDLEVFDDQVRAMRQWMQKHHQQEKPLILSEYSILYPYEEDGDSCFLQDEYGQCFTQERVERFLDATAEYFSTAKDESIGNPNDDYRLIQQTAWYSVYSEVVGNVSNLVKTDPAIGTTNLSPIGDAYKVQSASQNIYVNLIVEQLDAIVTRIVEPATTVSATLNAYIWNNGTISTSQSFDITFYSDSNLNEIIDTIHISEASIPGLEVAGCARRQLQVSIDWTRLAPGAHPYWVKVDSADQIDEGGPSGEGEEDNLVQGIVLVNQDRSFLPLILH
jgi:hypothetical protein